MRLIIAIVILGGLAAPAAADIADGTYWVRRVSGELRRGMEGAGIDGPGERWVTLRTECRPLAIASEAKRRELVIGGERASIHVDGDRWTISSPVVTSEVPPAVLRGQCKDTVAPASLPIFADRASCQAAPSSVTRRCLRDVCRYDGVAPFELPSCDAAFTALATDAARITGATHDEAMASLRRLADVARRGGKLWMFDPDAARCHPVTVKPKRDGAATLRQVIALGGGGRVTYNAEVRFEPLYQRARFISESRWSEGLGMGGYGTGDITTGLYLGKDVALAGHRWFYFDRRACDAGPR